MEMGRDAVCLNRMQYLNKGARWHDSLWWSSQQVGLHQNVVPLHWQHVHNDVISEAWNGLAWKDTEPSKSQSEVHIKNIGGGGGGVFYVGIHGAQFSYEHLETSKEQIYTTGTQLFAHSVFRIKIRNSFYNDTNQF